MADCAQVALLWPHICVAKMNAVCTGLEFLPEQGLDVSNTGEEKTVVMNRNCVLIPKLRLLSLLMPAVGMKSRARGQNFE